MKVIALTLTTLCLSAATQANWDYKLQCTREEVGIRWPSYYSNSDYYICPRQGGKQMTITCPPGEVFTFVLQSCTAPNKFIPPPPLNILPTSPVVDLTKPEPIEEEKPYFPKPIHKPENESPLRPPVLIHENQPSLEAPAPLPPVIIDDTNHPDIPVLPEVEIPEPPSKPGIPSLPGKPHNPSIPSKPVDKQEAPLPPTPPPTPPVVPVAQPPKKKQPPSLPGASKKQPPKLPGAAKKQPPRPAGKKQPPKPAGKKQIPSLPGRA